MASGRPNILHLFTDQQRWDTIRALGAPWMRTPTFDRLAAEGVAFTSAYSPSPVCAAARCCMLLGQYPWHTGLFENGPIRDDRITLVGGDDYQEYLRARDYRHVIESFGVRGEIYYIPQVSQLPP